MAKQSSVNLDITNNADGFDISGGTTPRKLGITGGDVTIAGSGSATVTFPTTSTTIAGLGITQSFSTLQSFSAGISAAGGVTFSGNISAPNIVTAFNGLTGAVTGVASIGGFTGTVTVTDGTYITVRKSSNDITFTNTGVQTFNGRTGAVTGASLGANTFTALNTFNAGISAAGSTFSSTTNTLDVIASTEGAGLRIAKAVTGANSRVGGIRLGRSGTTTQNIYLEGSAGAFAVYNGVDNTATSFASFSSTAFTIGATTATQLTLNCPGTLEIGDAAGTATLHNQKFTLNGSTRFFTFGDSNGTTAGFMGINRAYNGLCADYALEVNSPTGKGLQLIYNDHTGAASNWVNMDVSSGGNYTLRPSGGLATVTGTLNVSAGISAGGTTAATFNGLVDMNGGYSEAGATATQATNTITFNAASGNTQKFVPSAVVNTVNFTNINTISTQCTSATLIFLHGATPYGLTTGTFSVQLAGVTKTVKWSGGSAPTLTNTANKTDVLNFLTYDGGTTWLGFVGGLNF